MLLTDSYKETHWKQYPPGTSVVYSYFERSRGDLPDALRTPGLRRTGEVQQGGLGVHPQPTRRLPADLHQGGARGHRGSDAKRSLYDGEHRPELLLAHEFPGDLVGPGVVPNDRRDPVARAEDHAQHLLQGHGLRHGRPGVHAPRLRVPGRLVRGVGRYWRSGTPREFHGHGHHGSFGSMQALLP